MKPMAPGSILHHTSSIFHHTRSSFHHISFRFTSFAIFYFPIYKPKTPKIFTLPFIYLYQISPSQVTMKGLTTPLSRWVQVVVCLCRYSVTCALSPTGLIHWFSKLREIFTLLFRITLSPSRGNPMQAQEVAGRISGAIAGETYDKTRHTKYPS